MIVTVAMPPGTIRSLCPDSPDYCKKQKQHRHNHGTDALESDYKGGE